MTTISAKIENSDKTLFETICNSMGLNISTAITAFVKATIRENGLPMALKAADDPLHLFRGKYGLSATGNSPD